MRVIIIGKNSSIFQDIKNFCNHNFSFSHNDKKLFQLDFKKNDTLIYFGIDMNNNFENSFDKKIIDISIKFQCRLIFFSSRKVYKLNQNNFYSEKSYLIKSKNLYISLKLKCENYISKYHNNFIILRLGTYLPIFPSNKRESFDFILRNNLKNNNLIFDQNIYSYKDFLFRSRMVKAINKLLISDLKNKTFNLSSGFKTSLIDLSKMIEISKKPNLKIKNQNFSDSFLLDNSLINQELNLKYDINNHILDLKRYITSLIDEISR